jgi:hypothetical protein
MTGEFDRRPFLAGELVLGQNGDPLSFEFGEKIAPQKSRKIIPKITVISGNVRLLNRVLILEINRLEQVTKELLEGSKRRPKAL